MTAIYQGWPGEPQPSEPGSIAPDAKTDPQHQNAEHEGATETLAQRIAGPLPEPQKQQAGRLIHYLFGASVGGVYGAVKPHGHHPILAMAYASAVFSLGRQVAVPLLGLSSAKTPPSLHLHSWVAHLAWGLTVDWCLSRDES